MDATKDDGNRKEIAYLDNLDLRGPQEESRERDWDGDPNHQKEFLDLDMEIQVRVAKPVWCDYIESMVDEISQESEGVKQRLLEVSRKLSEEVKEMEAKNKCVVHKMDWINDELRRDLASIERTLREMKAGKTRDWQEKIGKGHSIGMALIAFLAVFVGFPVLVTFVYASIQYMAFLIGKISTFTFF